MRNLRNIVESYLYSRPQLSVTTDEVVQFLEENLNDLYYSDPDTYNQLYELPTLDRVKVLESCLDYEYSLDIPHKDILYAASILPALYLIFKGSKLTKAVFKAFHAIGSVLQKVGDFLKKHGFRSRVRYEVVNKTFEQCLKQAGIDDPSKVSLPVYIYIRKTSEGLVPATKKQIEQADKLRECYTEMLIKQIANVADVYFECLKNAGKLDEFADVAAADIITALQSVSKKYKGSCSEIYNHLYEMLDKFRMYVEFVYPESVDQAEVYDKLHAELRSVLRRHLEERGRRDIERHRDTRHRPGRDHRR